MELGCEPEKKKKAQESEDERWARMDKRIERASSGGSRNSKRGFQV